MNTCRSFLRAAAALLAAASFAASAHAVASQSDLYPAFTHVQWLSDTGNKLSLEDLKGQVIVMTMGYSGCRKTCSTSVLVLKELQSLLDRLGKTAQFVVVTYDPANDTPEAWQEYRKSRGLTRPNWHFLSGSAPDTRRMANLLDLNFWSMDDHILHDFRIVVFDRGGHYAKEVVWQTQKDLDHLFDGL
jgi:protein SCO1/2